MHMNRFNSFTDIELSGLLIAQSCLTLIAKTLLGDRHSLFLGRGTFSTWTISDASEIHSGIRRLPSTTSQQAPMWAKQKMSSATNSQFSTIYWQSSALDVHHPSTHVPSTRKSAAGVIFVVYFSGMLAGESRGFQSARHSITSPFYLTSVRTKVHF